MRARLAVASLLTALAGCGHASDWASTCRTDFEDGGCTVRTRCDEDCLGGESSIDGAVDAPECVNLTPDVGCG